jgi:hypothetical protein
MAEISTLRGEATGGGGLMGGGEQELFVYGTYLFLTKYRRQIIYIGRHFAWLTYFTYHLVPVLAPNYNQHILPPAIKLEK